MKARIPLTAGLAVLLCAASVLCFPIGSARAEFSAEVLDHSENLMTALGYNANQELPSFGLENGITRGRVAGGLPYCLGLFLDEELRALINTHPDRLVKGTTVARGDFYEVEISVGLEYAVSFGTTRVDRALIGMKKRYDDGIRASTSSTVIQYSYDAVGRLVKVYPSTAKKEGSSSLSGTAFRTEGSIRYEMARIDSLASAPFPREARFFMREARFSVTRGQVNKAAVAVDLQANGWVKYQTYGLSVGETAFRETNTPTEGLREKGTIRDYYRLTAAGVQPVRSVETREDARYVGGLVIKTGGGVTYTAQPGRGFSAYGRFVDNAADPYGFRQTQVREEIYGTMILGRAFLQERKIKGSGRTAWNPTTLSHVGFRFGGPAGNGQPATETYTYDGVGRLILLSAAPIRIESSKRLGRSGSFTSVTTIEKRYKMVMGSLLPDQVIIRQETNGSELFGNVSRLKLLKDERIIYANDAVGRLVGATQSYGEFSGEIWERVGGRGPEVKKGIKGTLVREYSVVNDRLVVSQVVRKQEETFPFTFTYGGRQWTGTDRKQYESRTGYVLGGSHPDWDGPGTRPNLLLDETTETVDIATDSSNSTEHFIIHSQYGIPPGQPKVWGVIKTEKF